MSIRLKGWLSILFTVIILNLTINGNLLLGAEERLVSLTGLEGESFSYTFEKPDNIVKPEWKALTPLPPGLGVSKTGILYGTPNIAGSDTDVFHFDVEVSGKSSDDLSSIRKKIFTVRLQVQQVPNWIKAEKLRAFAGYEQSGASSAQPGHRIVISLYHSNPFPLPYKNEKMNPLGKPLRIWQSVRFSSIPLQLTSSLVDIPETFKKEISSIKANELVRSVEFLAGLDLRIFQNPREIDHKTMKIYTLSLIGAFGFSTPLSNLDATKKFKLTDATREALINRYKENFDIDISKNLEGKDNVAFVEPDRKNFFRQWLFGLRFKSYTRPRYGKENDRFLYKFPTYFEVSVGRNEVIVRQDELTGRNLRKTVLRFDGQFSFKKFPLYFFGTAMIQFNKQKKVEPIIMEPALNVLFPGDDFGQVLFPDETRDYYRVGLGVDIMEIADIIFSPNSDTKKGTSQ